MAVPTRGAGFFTRRVKATCSHHAPRDVAGPWEGLNTSEMAVPTRGAGIFTRRVKATCSHHAPRDVAGLWDRAQRFENGSADRGAGFFTRRVKATGRSHHTPRDVAGLWEGLSDRGWRCRPWRRLLHSESEGYVAITLRVMWPAWGRAKRSRMAVPTVVPASSLGE